MSERLTPARLQELREAWADKTIVLRPVTDGPRGGRITPHGGHPWAEYGGAGEGVRALLAHIDAQQAEIDRLTSQVAALRESLEAIWRMDAVPNALLEDVEVALADTEAAARAHDAREWESGYEAGYTLAANERGDESVNGWEASLRASIGIKAWPTKWNLAELRGKKLACWCKPQACHGDVLAELADMEADDASR